MLKPIQFPRFLQAVEKAYSIYQKDKKIKELSERKPVEDFEKKIFLKAGTRLLQVRVSEILYIEGLKDYLVVYLTAARKIITHKNFAEMLEDLPQPYFVRTHKSYIVSLLHIEYIDRLQIGINKAVIPIGRHYKTHFLEQFRRYKNLFS